MLETVKRRCRRVTLLNHTSCWSTCRRGIESAGMIQAAAVDVPESGPKNHRISAASGSARANSEDAVPLDAAHEPPGDLASDWGSDKDRPDPRQTSGNAVRHGRWIVSVVFTARAG